MDFFKPDQNSNTILPMGTNVEDRTGPCEILMYPDDQGFRYIHADPTERNLAEKLVRSGYEVRRIGCYQEIAGSIEKLYENGYALSPRVRR